MNQDIIKAALPKGARLILNQDWIKHKKGTVITLGEEKQEKDINIIISFPNRKECVWYMLDYPPEWIVYQENVFTDEEYKEIFV